MATLAANRILCSKIANLAANLIFDLQICLPSSRLYLEYIRGRSRQKTWLGQIYITTLKVHKCLVAFSFHYVTCNTLVQAWEI